MPRVKRSVHARKKRRKVLEQAKGYWGLKNSRYRYAKEQVEHSLVYAYRDRKNKKRTFRRLWIIRINAAARAERALVQPVRRRPAARPEIELDRKVLADLAVSDPQALRRDRRAGEGRARGLSEHSGEVFRRAGRAVRGPARRCTRDLCRRVRGRARSSAELVGHERAGTCRCGSSAGCTTSCSAASALAWDDPLAEHARRSSRDFVREQGVQTNEVQRCWVLLPLLPPRSPQRTAPTTLDLVELGPSAGLNLVWDRYRYRYAAGEWGRDGRAARLRRSRSAAGAGDAARRCEPRVRGARRDRPRADRRDDRATARGCCDCVRLGRPGGADGAARRGRSRRCATSRRSSCAATTSSELPRVLADEPSDGLTVVFQTASFGYIGDEGRAARALGARGARAGAAARVRSRPGSRASRGALAGGCGSMLWPGRRARVRSAHADFHGAWLEWRAVITSRDNPKLKLIHRLLESRRQREKQGLFVVRGRGSRRRRRSTTRALDRAVDAAAAPERTCEQARRSCSRRSRRSGTRRA